MDCIDIAQFGATPIMPFPLVAANDDRSVVGQPARWRPHQAKIRPLTALD